MSSPFAFTHGSPIGVFTIVWRREFNWCIEHDEERLGWGHPTPQRALDSLVNGDCDWPGVTNPSTLGLPDDIADWHTHFRSM